MNTQRWIALGIIAATVACAASSNLWLSLIVGGTESDAEQSPASDGNEAPLADEEPPELEQSFEAENDVMFDFGTEPTLNPAVVDIMSDMGIDELGVGLDPFVVLGGDFEVIDQLHQGRGTALVYWFSEQQQFLRLESFDVTNGPDLQVVLSQHPAPRTSAEALLPTHVRLGNLLSSEGDQNYEIPAETDLSRYKSAVIYSSSLNIVYTSAPLQEVRGQ